MSLSYQIVGFFGRVKNSPAQSTSSSTFTTKQSVRVRNASGSVRFSSVANRKPSSSLFSPPVEACFRQWKNWIWKNGGNSWNKGDIGIAGRVNHDSQKMQHSWLGFTKRPVRDHWHNFRELWMADSVSLFTTNANFDARFWDEDYLKSQIRLFS